MRYLPKATIAILEDGDRYFGPLGKLLGSAGEGGRSSATDLRLNLHLCGLKSTRCEKQGPLEGGPQAP